MLNLLYPSHTVMFKSKELETGIFKMKVNFNEYNENKFPRQIKNSSEMNERLFPRLWV